MRTSFGIGWIILILTLAGIPAGCGSSGDTSTGPAPTSTDGKTITVRLGQEFQLEIGQRATVSDAPLDIVFHRITGDSRCPRDATCIWQGEASAEIEIIGGDGSHLMTLTEPGLFEDYSRETYSGYEIAFRILPYPTVENPVPPGEYTLKLRVIRAVTLPGTLTGRVTIGPLQPVARPDDDPYDVPPEVYEGRKVMVYDESGDTLIQRVDIGHDGLYRVELPPDTYIIDINRAGMDSSGDVPREIIIRSGEMTQLDIDIDTGIR